MKRSKFIVVSCLGVGFVLVACNEAFQPQGTYDDKMVVYGVLTNRSDTQFVRVYSTYNPSGFNPLNQTADNPVTDAQVSIANGPFVEQLRDTLVTRLDSSRYTGGIKAFVGYPFAVTQGTAYTLSVVSKSKGTATATTTLPSKASITLTNSYVLENPSLIYDAIVVSTILGSNARGFVLRMFLEYQVQSGGGFIEQVEVPGFPALARVEGTRQTLFLSTNTYISYVRAIQKKYVGIQVRFKRAIFLLTQVDLPLYNYYNIVNGFRDNYSIRVDQPDYTNVKRGIGVFGSFSVDSLTYEYATGVITLATGTGAQ